MSKSTNSNKQGAEAPAAAPAINITLDEFCLRLSERVRRPELVTAFARVERVAGRVKAAPAVFQARFEAFVKTPA